MSKGGSIGGGKSSRGVSKSKHGGGTITTTKTVARKTKDVNDSIIKLREAIFTPSGADKDVSQGIRVFECEMCDVKQNLRNRSCLHEI